MPDQVTAARSILNDWNAGSIPYHTVPPAIHPSSIPSVPRAEAGLGLDNPTSNVDINDDSKTLTTAADVGSAQIVSKFSEPFDLDGLFSLTDKAVLDNDGEDEIVDDAHMEGIDADEGVNRDVEDADAVQDETALEEPYVQSSPFPCIISLTFCNNVTAHPSRPIAHLNVHTHQRHPLCLLPPLPLPQHRNTNLSSEPLDRSSFPNQNERDIIQTRRLFSTLKRSKRWLAQIPSIGNDSGRRQSVARRRQRTWLLMTRMDRLSARSMMDLYSSQACRPSLSLLRRTSLFQMKTRTKSCRSHVSLYHTAPLISFLEYLCQCDPQYKKPPYIVQLLIYFSIIYICPYHCIISLTHSHTPRRFSFQSVTFPSPQLTARILPARLHETRQTTSGNFPGVIAAAPTAPDVAVDVGFGSRAVFVQEPCGESFVHISTVLSFKG